MYSNKWRNNFRHDTFRPGQDTLTEKIATYLDEGYEYIVAEAPTGVGKSDVAMALAKSSSEKSYVTTSQNILINQYVNDFIEDSDFYYIKGKRNYECCGKSFDGRGYSDIGINCEDGSDSKCMNSVKHNDEDYDLSCTYKLARDRAVLSKVAFTNMAYYIHGCGNPAIWPTRELAIHDEAHNIASIVLDNVSFTLKEYVIKKLGMYGVPMFPSFKSSTANDPNKRADHEKRGFYEIDPKELCEYCLNVQEGLNFFIEQSRTMRLGNNDEIRSAEKLTDKIQSFLYSLNEGVEWVVDHHILKDSGLQKIVARPLNSGYFCQRMLFDGRVMQNVMQSATIINPVQYFKELGLPMNQNKIRFIRNKSPFNLVANRPIYPLSVGSMNYKSIKSTLPIMAEKVYQIIKNRPNQKGLIHTNSYVIMNYLKEELLLSDIGSRCLFADAKTRNSDLEEYMDSDKPLVIFSPSLTEGIDGKYDKLRFQVMCKVPYPFIGDRRVAIKMNRDQEWYNYMTAKTLVQAIGRGVRSDDDWCENFVLDSSFSNFCNSGALPGEFLNTINYNGADRAIKNPRGV